MSRRRFLPISLLCLCLLLVAACSSTGGASSNTTSNQTASATRQPDSDLPSPTAQTLPDLLQTEQVLLMAQPQASNLYALARELKTHRSGSPSSGGSSTPLNRRTGQEDTFWVQNQDTGAWTQIKARLIIVTAHAYIYVQDGQPFNQTALQNSASAFEQQIYPTERAAAGSEWTPGIDGDKRLTMLNAASLGSTISGYFSAQDEYPASINLYSNQREMFYLNLDSVIPGSTGYNSVMASELQQLITWHEHPLSQSWVNQGLALLAQHINHYPVNGVDSAFLKEPDTQLTAWSSDPAKEPAYAGASYLFMDYFAEHYGGYSIIKDLLTDPAPPPLNFEHVLAQQHSSDHFTDVLNKWLVANLVADPSIDGGTYGYPSMHLPGVAVQQQVSTYPYQVSDSVSQYGAQYYDLRPPGGKGANLSVQFTGTPTVRLVSNDPLDSAAEWWGNRAANMDSTLTRVFDLSSLKGQHATLQFATWFDLQANRDYAYVEVSTDNGTNWHTLKGNFTTADNPNGVNWGNGYTGLSGDGEEPAWVQETIDLTPYAGHKIQLRFEEITGNTASHQGFAVDRIRLPELHYQDNDTTDGWVSKGFVSTSNMLPEHFLVQAIVYTGQTFTVQPVNVDLATARGTLNLANFGNKVTRVVLIVSAYALDTTLQAHYQLEVHA